MKTIKNKRILITSISVLSVLILTLLSFLYYQIQLHSVTSTSEVVIFEVKQGEGVYSVVSRLANEGIIKNETCTKLYIKLHHIDSLKAGFFEIDKAWNTQEIFMTLQDDQSAKAKQEMITFREGLWAKDIAKIIEERLGIPQEELLSLWNDDAYLKTLIDRYEFLDESILQENVNVKLEGYLYPETYAFHPNATAQEVTEVFLNQFDKVYQELKTDIQASDLSMHELLTLASMVQYESKTKEDMYLIAGVFYNRLAIDMPLGSSVTICYALYDEYKKAEDCELNSDIDSPYNTYIHKGLPIGPILNPGKDALEATLHPKDSEYLYFMADIYGDGSVYYAKTEEEHNANVQKYLR